MIQLQVSRRSSSKSISATPIRFRFANSQPADPRVATVTAEELLPSRSNYFTANDRSQWRPGIENYGRLRYLGLYPGVDLVFYGNQGGRLEFDYVIAPGADPREIALDVDCACRMQLNRDGDLVLAVPRRNPASLRADDAPVVFHRPVAYQRIDGKRIAVDADFRIRGRRISFKLGAYDPQRTLTIDPIFAFVSYFGGDPSGSFGALASAANGEVLIAMTNNAYAPDHPGGVWVARLASSGTSLLYTTHLGPGSIAGLQTDESGAAYLAGTTRSAAFPTTAGAYQASAPPTTQDMQGQPRQYAFVAKLNAAGVVDYSTYFAGGGIEIAQAFTIDGNGNAYVLGRAYSTDFPVTSGVYQNSPTPGLQAPVSFVAKLNETGSELVYATLFPAETTDIAVDGEGNAYVTGVTASEAFPTTPGAYQQTKPNGLVTYLTKLNAAGSALVYSTFLGEGVSTTIAVDSAGAAYVAGQTFSDTFPTTVGAYQRLLSPPPSAHFPPPPGSDVFVTRFSPDGSSLVFSTLVGGDRDDIPRDLELDGAGKPHVYAYSLSSNFPNAGTASGSGVVFRLNTSGTQLEYARYLGPWTDIWNGKIDTDSAGNMYVGGVAANEGKITTRDGYALLSAPFHGDTSFILRIENVSDAVLAMPTAVSLGEQRINTTGTRLQLLLNLGDQTLHVTGVAVTGVDFSQTNDCATLTAGQSCTVTIKSGMLVVTDDTGGGVLQSLLSGTGINPVIVLNQTASTFGSVPVGKTSAPLGLVFTNVGTTQATLQLGPSTNFSPSEYEPGDFSHTNQCGVIAPSSSCTESIFFTPTALGLRRYHLHVYSNASLDFPGEVNFIVGTGVVPVTLAPTTDDFGEQPIGIPGTAHAITLMNDGGSAVTINSINLSGPFSQTNNCPGSLPGGSSCTLQVTFAPTVLGPASGLLTVSDTGLGGLRAASLQGTGIPVPMPSISFTENSLSFPATVVGAYAPPRVVNMSNSGAGRLDFESVTAPPGYILSHNCGHQLLPGNACSLQLGFKPYQTGSHTGAVTVNGAASMQGSLPTPLTVPVSGSGVDFQLSLTRSSRPGRHDGSLVISSGQAAAIAMELNTSGEVRSEVRFHCQGLPAGATCSTVHVKGTSYLTTIRTAALGSRPKRLRKADSSSVGRHRVRITAEIQGVTRTQEFLLEVQ